MTVSQFEAAFPHEDACDAYLVARRWPNGVICPRCGSDRPYELTTMKFKWECPDCSAGGYRFSNIAGTIFQNTNVDLRVWYRVIHLMLTNKKGMSARQIHRYIGFGSYKTAWYMCHRIRAALVEKDFDKLGGVVEVAETFVGGKAHNQHGGRSGGGGVSSGKIPVVGAVSRKGNVVARVISTVSANVLTKFVMNFVSDKVSLLVTAEWTGYRHVKKIFPHQVIKHAAGEYVVGAIHTILKRGIVGNYHKVSKKYLPLHVAEFQFRYNN
jgi:transposase-like protein